MPVLRLFGEAAAADCAPSIPRAHLMTVLSMFWKVATAAARVDCTIGILAPLEYSRACPIFGVWERRFDGSTTQNSGNSVWNFSGATVFRMVAATAVHHELHGPPR
jgi:hypothetical protein